MSAIKDLLASERGLFGLLLVISATALTALDRMTVVQWQDFSTWIFGIYVSGKSLTGAIGLLKGSSEASAAPAAATPAAEPAAAAPAAPAAASAEAPATPAA